MHLEPPPEALTALQLIRAGRFSEAVPVLQNRTTNHGQSLRKSHPLSLAVLADALQRVGENDRAEEIASGVLKTGSSDSQVKARCYFALGNVHRDRGNTTQAIEHLQIAASTASSDLELSCWTQLRLMVVVSELSGAPTAMGRIDEVRRTLTRFGDARPFAGLHLWLVEVECMHGNLTKAREHLKAAESLLSTVEDVWLKGYLAINSSAVHYYAAEIIEARHWAVIGAECAKTSGHRATLRAANANLGNIELSLGNDLQAEQCFEVALNCCEPGSVHHIAILDNIAQIRLHRGDLDGCRSLIALLDTLIEQNNYHKRRHYNACALHTKIRLLLREGNYAEALSVSKDVTRALQTSQARIGTETHLLNVEALLANKQSTAAADALSGVFSSTHTLSPDLFAKLEHISGLALASSESFHLARVRLERAMRAFNTIGHTLGKERSAKAFLALSDERSETATLDVGAQRSLDRIRALMDLRTRPELFGHEAVAFLKELACASAITLVVEDKTQMRVAARYGDEIQPTPCSAPMSITIDSGSHRTVTLAFLPLDEVKAKLTALAFVRVLKQMLAVGPNEPVITDQEIVWTVNEGVPSRHGVLFGSETMFGILRTVKQIAPTDVSVLVTGETGVGKEVIAKTIHEYSRRAAMPFLALNCAAVPKDLLESQLFGHRKGAFSGAAESHQGIVRAANGGTLFLDEIGEIPLDMQAKLLRFLEVSEVHPVGESHPVKVNVRLIFATNGDLEEAVSQNRFRQDLYYRLNVIPIKVPPLRERREEIPVLANLFAQRFAAEFEKTAVRFSSSAMELLILYSWPGNIRQLANEVRRIAALTESGTCIEPEHLSPHLQAQAGRSRGEAVNGAPQMQIRIDQPLDKATADLESEMIRRALRQAGGRLTAAASTLGISRKGLYLKRLRLGITDASLRMH
jgi:DNA-binding NtrC family response regulator/tetratricopeptide (TPR) repeat protein